MNSNKPSKFETLETLRDAGFTVPQSLLVAESDIDCPSLRKRVTNFITECNAEHYIVRSAVATEDGVHKSYAGYFASSESVRASEIRQTTQELFKENKIRAEKLGVSGGVYLFIMPYITAQIGGVAFTPWHYFHRHSLVTTANTPSEAVAGMNTSTLLLDHSKQDHAEAWENRLAELIKKLHDYFDTPLDIEWADTGTAIYLLQVRPIIIQPNGLHIEELRDAELNTSALSQAFGKLSPLSFSLLQELYRDNTLLRQHLHIHADEPFLIRKSNGQIFEHIKKKGQYFANTHWYSAFTRSFTSTLHTFPDPPLKVTQDFSLERSRKCFAYWQIISHIQGPASINVPGEYELSQPARLESYTTESLSDRWKLAFLHSIQPLRSLVQTSPNTAWCTLDSSGLINEGPIETYGTELSESLHWYDNKPTVTDLSTHGLIQGKTKLITNPDTWLGPLPKDVIIITSHIPVHWVSDLPFIQGIIVQSLPPLSHAAITLREHGIPHTTHTDT